MQTKITQILIKKQTISFAKPLFSVKFPSYYNKFEQHMYWIMTNLKLR